jgi:hypothetical protein
MAGTIDELVASEVHKAVVKERIEINRLHDMLHRDQTNLARGLEQVLGLVAGFEWTATTRGPYEWDDDDFHKEMGSMLSQIRAAAQNAIDRWKRGPLPCCKPPPDSVPAGKAE